MRLSEGTRTKIKEVFAELAPAPFDLKLFGSRLDDQKRGGDIDLLLTVEAQNLQAFKVEGLGIALLPTLFCYPETQSEKLVRVLREWKSNVRPVHFIYPHQDFVPKKLSAFLDVGTEVIRSSLRSSTDN